MEAFRQRIEAAMTKSMREAKIHTTWASPDMRLRGRGPRLRPARARCFALESVLGEFLWISVAKVAPLGVWNSLVQTVLKLTVPGVPDIYQGAELWDLNFVDPDNRRPVDFQRRRELLATCASGVDLSALLEGWEDCAIKLRLIADLLEFRRRHPTLFQNGSYEAVTAEGPAADRICSFVRRGDDSAILIAALLYPSRGPAGLKETKILLPKGLGTLSWASLFENYTPASHDGSIAARCLFAKIPIIVLVESG